MGCSKTPGSPVTPPAPTPSDNVSRIEYDNRSIAVIYSTDKRLLKTVTSYASGVTPSETAYRYDNGLLSETEGGAKWKYSYTAGKLTRIETYNEQGVLRYEVVFDYAGDQVAVKMESTVSLLGTKTPYFRSFYTYDASGNVEKQEVQQRINGQWEYVEHVLYPAYDNKPNFLRSFESHPFLPATVFAGNNPLKEIFMDYGRVTETVEYTYSYDAAGRVSKRVALHKPVGFPDYSEEVRLYY